MISEPVVAELLEVGHRWGYATAGGRAATPSRSQNRAYHLPVRLIFGAGLCSLVSRAHLHRKQRETFPDPNHRDEFSKCLGLNPTLCL